MRHELRKLPVDGATGGHASSAYDVRDLVNMAVIVASTGVTPTPDAFSVKIQGAIKGGGAADSNGVWVDLTGAIVGDTIVALDRVGTTDLGGYSMPFTHLRVYVTTKGTNPPQVLVAGRNARTH